MRQIRCAIYTRKSSEDGLEQDFNSLDAQREACEAYIASQKHEGWVLLKERYDDGGISGGHLDRPALQKLMQAVDEKRVDQIVVYKIDRLTRSLIDFAKLVDRLDTAEASFVSVTQSFNTATSMGRLTLNMLLSFAQFEREVTAERIRDKITASKRRGLWMGGNVPLGYQAEGRTLKIDEIEAATIRTLYDLYLQHGVIREVVERSEDLGLTSRRRVRGSDRISGGKPFDRGHIHYILTNPIYAGRIPHKGQVHDGQHPAIIAPEIWDKVQVMLKNGAAKARGRKQQSIRSPLAGKLFDETGDRLTPTHTRKNGRRHRYYISRRLVTDRSQNHPEAWRLPAEELENLIADLIKTHLHRNDCTTRIIRDIQASGVAEYTAVLHRVHQPSLLLRLVERADISPGTMSVRLSADELAQVIQCDANRIIAEELTIKSPFRTRRRGVELKLHLGDAPAAIDRILVQNIVTAQKWLAMIIDGKSFAEIADLVGTSKRRVQDVVDLALLAPDVLEAIAAGKQPAQLTSDHLIKSGYPVCWSGQRKLFAGL